MLFDKATIVKTLADKIDGSVRDVFINDETELESFEDGNIAKLVNSIPGCTADDVTEKDINKVIKSVNTESTVIESLDPKSLDAAKTRTEKEISDLRKEYNAANPKERQAISDRIKVKEKYITKIEDQLKNVEESYDSIEDIVTEEFRDERSPRRMRLRDGTGPHGRGFGPGGGKGCKNEASYNPIDDIVNGGYEESLFRGMSEEAGDKDADEDEEKLEAEERRLEKYARTAKGKKKASYGKKIDEIEEEKKELKESYDSIEDIFLGW